MRDSDGRRRCDPSAVDLTSLEPPYDAIVQAARDEKQDHEIIQLGGLSAYQTSLLAAESIPLSESVGTYLELLRRTATLTRAGMKFRRMADRMIRGGEIDTAEALSVLQNIDSDSYEWMTMDQVEAETNVWIPTNWRAWDEYFGGIPKSGMIIMAGPPGTGKTSAVLKLIDRMTRSRKRCAFMSLEMQSEIVKMRWLELRTKLSDEQAAYLHISDSDYSLDEACASIAQLVSSDPEVYAIFIDYADLMVAEESTENASKIYIKISKLAKKIGKPIFLVSQLSRNYVGGIPHVTDVRYSGLAEAAAVMIVLLYNPDQLFVDMGKTKETNQLPYIEDMAYLIIGKSRYGYKMGGTGAVRIPWRKAEGWGNDGDGWERL